MGLIAAAFGATAAVILLIIGVSYIAARISPTISKIFAAFIQARAELHSEKHLEEEKVAHNAARREKNARDKALTPFREQLEKLTLAKRRAESEERRWADAAKLAEEAAGELKLVNESAPDRRKTPSLGMSAIPAHKLVGSNSASTDNATFSHHPGQENGPKNSL